MDWMSVNLPETTCNLFHYATRKKDLECSAIHPTRGRITHLLLLLRCILAAAMSVLQAPYATCSFFSSSRNNPYPLLTASLELPDVMFIANRFHARGELEATHLPNTRFRATSSILAHKAFYSQKKKDTFYMFACCLTQKEF